jgi:hypothetical protein
MPLPSSGITYLETLREQTAILTNQELRAAWVVRYTLTSQDEIDRAHEAGIAIHAWGYSGPQRFLQDELNGRDWKPIELLGQKWYNGS